MTISSVQLQNTMSYNVCTNEKLTCHLEPRKHLFVRCLLDTARLNIRQFRHCPSYRPQTKVHNHLWSSRQSLSFRPSIAVQSYSWENMWVLLPELKTEKTKVRWEVSKNEWNTHHSACILDKAREKGCPDTRCRTWQLDTSTWPLMLLLVVAFLSLTNARRG